VEWSYAAKGISNIRAAASDSSFCYYLRRRERKETHLDTHYLAAGVHISSLFVLFPSSIRRERERERERETWRYF